MKNVKCELWKVCVCDGVMGYVHGQYNAINEFYLPKYNISFNIMGDEVHVFRSSTNRYIVDETKPTSSKKVSDIDGVPESFAKNLNRYLESKDKMNSKVSEFIVKNGGHNR